MSPLCFLKTKNPFWTLVQRGFTWRFQTGKPFLFVWLVAWTEDAPRLKRSWNNGKQNEIEAEKTERQIHNSLRCQKWHSRLGIMLLVTASVADRLVGCWLERDCLPVCSRSRPHAPLTSAAGRLTNTAAPPSCVHPDGEHTTNNMHDVFTENERFFYIYISLHLPPPFVLHFSTSYVKGRVWMPILPLRCGFIWLCNLKKLIFNREEKQQHQPGTCWLFYHAKKKDFCSL